MSYAWKSTGSREDTSFSLYCHDLHCRVCYRKLSYKNIKNGTNNNTVISPTYLTCLPFYLIFVYIIFKTYIVINIVNNIIKIIMSIMIITALVLIGWIHTMPSATGHCGQKQDYEQGNNVLPGDSQLWFTDGTFHPQLPVEERQGPLVSNLPH